MSSFLSHRRKAFRGGGGTGYLLDDYAGASAAYSLRELTTTSWNAGDWVIRAGRGGDLVQADFTATEITDGTIDAWSVAGSGTGIAWVVRWYDQSGNSNNASNVSFPLIVQSGAVLANGILFDGNDDSFNCGFGHGSTSAQSMMVVGQTSDLTTVRTQLSGFEANDDGLNLSLLGGGGDGVRISVDAVDVFTSATLANVEYLWSAFYGSSTATIFRDGTQEATDTVSASINSGTQNYFIGRIGYTSATYWKGSIQEIIIYPDDQSANQAGIDGNITTHYGI